MTLLRCGPREFLEQATPFLLADEVYHNLLLGVPAGLIARPAAPAEPPYFAVVLEDGRVAAAAMMTPPHPLVLSRTERPSALESIARDLIAAGIAPPGVHGPASLGEEFAVLWHRLTGRRYELSMTQGLYRLTAVRAVRGVPGSLRPAIAQERGLVLEWLRAFNAEAFASSAAPFDAEQVADRRIGGRTEALYFWDHEGPRTLAGSAGPTPHGIRVGPIFTPPEHRNHGYASACTAELSRLLLERGYQFCFLYTDLANPTSNRIYQRIGYEPVCTVTIHRFLPGNSP